MDEFEIEWVPDEEEEDMNEIFESKPHFEPPKIEVELTTSQIDRLCKNKYGHDNWVRMGRISPIELAGNPHFLDHERGIIFFKKPHKV